MRERPSGALPRGSLRRERLFMFGFVYFPFAVFFIAAVLQFALSWLGFDLHFLVAMGLAVPVPLGIGAWVWKNPRV